MVEPLRWEHDQRKVYLLDQTRLPVEEVWLEITTPEQMAEAIRMLRVRGAPAIGHAAAYGVVLSVREEERGTSAYQRALQAIELLGRTRPTAVNLFRSLERMRAVVETFREDRLFDPLLAEAKAMYAEDQQASRQIGLHGLEVIKPGMNVLTHCHTGGVATSGYGTALAVFHLAKEQGIPIHVYVDETRPLLQGARITAWELMKADIPATLITDSMAGMLMQQGRVDAVFVGADRVAANGDVANKIGTYSLAVLAAAHNIPFYVALPLSTVDLDMPHGGAIQIEERAPEEITHGFGRQTAPAGVKVYNPAFDVTPAYLVTAWITERGIVRPPFEEKVRQWKPLDPMISHEPS